MARAAPFENSRLQAGWGRPPVPRRTSSHTPSARQVLILVGGSDGLSRPGTNHRIFVVCRLSAPAHRETGDTMRSSVPPEVLNHGAEGDNFFTRHRLTPFCHPISTAFAAVRRKMAQGPANDVH